jgi:leucyl aminopeptidase
MLDQPIHCVVTEATDARPLHAARPDGLAELLGALPDPQAAYLRDVGFQAAAGEFVLLAGAEGLAGAVLGLGEECLAISVRRAALPAAGGLDLVSAAGLVQQ